MKKIMFFINTLDGGGAERVLVDLLNCMDTDSYEIDLITVTQGINKKFLTDKINYYPIIKTNNKVINNLLKKIVYHIPKRLFSLLFMRKKYDIEVAYLEGFPTSVIGARRNNAKKIAFIHFDVSKGNILSSYYKDKQGCLNEYGRFSRVCFVSNQSKIGFEKTIGKLDNACVVHNVLDYKEIKKRSLEKVDIEYSTNGLKLLSIGRLAKQKGYGRLIKILAELEKRYEFELFIVGEGPERSYLETLIEKYQIKSVRLIGYMQNPYPFMKKADIFVCSSIFEGYSTVVTEATSLGLPVITTDCAGMDEILGNGQYGLIVPNTDNDLKNGLIRLLEDETVLKELKVLAQKRSEMLNSDIAIEEYVELFE